MTRQVARTTQVVSCCNILCRFPSVTHALILSQPAVLPHPLASRRYQGRCLLSCPCRSIFHQPCIYPAFKDQLVELALKLRQGARQLHEQHVPTQDFFFDGDLIAAIGSFWDGIETFTGGFRAHNNLGYLMTSRINFRSTGTFVRANPTQKKGTDRTWRTRRIHKFHI